MQLCGMYLKDHVYKNLDHFDKNLWVESFFAQKMFPNLFAKLVKNVVVFSKNGQFWAIIGKSLKVIKTIKIQYMANI